MAAIDVAPATQQPNSAASTPLQWIFSNALEKVTVTHSKSHAARVQ